MSKYYDIYEDIERKIHSYQTARNGIISLQKQSGEHTVKGELEAALNQFKALEKRMLETDFGWKGPDADTCRSKLYELDAQANSMVLTYDLALQNMLEFVEQKIAELQPQLSDALDHFDDGDYVRLGLKML